LKARHSVRGVFWRDRHAYDGACRSAVGGKPALGKTLLDALTQAITSSEQAA
jgi:hypothetical protein